MTQPRDLNDAERDYELFKQCGFNPALYRKAKNGQVVLNNKQAIYAVFTDGDSYHAHALGVSLEG